MRKLLLHEKIDAYLKETGLGPYGLAYYKGRKFRNPKSRALDDYKVAKDYDKNHSKSLKELNKAIYHLKSLLTLSVVTDTANIESTLKKLEMAKEQWNPQNDEKLTDDETWQFLQNPSVSGVMAIKHSDLEDKSRPRLP